MKLPDTHDIEEGFIGGLMMNNSAWYAVSDIVSKEMFADDDLGELYDIISTSKEHGYSPDIVLVSRESRKRNLRISASQIAELTDKAA